MHGFETLQEQTPEQAREHANWQKEAGPAGNPSLAVRRYAAARNDTVNMRMVLEVLAPAVQDSRDRKSTRLNSSHSQISYAVFCLKKKKRQKPPCDSTERWT